MKKGHFEGYLRNALANANESTLNADGHFTDDMYFSGGDQDFFSAQGGAAPAPTSMPYIINVTSASASAVSNFDVLGSFEYLSNAGWSNGDLVIGSVTISSGIPGITYQQMLYQFQVNPYSVGQTYLQSATANQITQVISVVTKDANGSIAQRPMIPTIDPYQQQNNVLIARLGYRIDGFTKLTIASILANATLTIQFYPSDNIALSRGLAGQAVSRQFASPGIERPQPVKMVN